VRLISLTELAAILPRCSLYAVAPFPRWADASLLSRLAPTFAHPDACPSRCHAASLPSRRSSHARSRKTKNVARRDTPDAPRRARRTEDSKYARPTSRRTRVTPYDATGHLLPSPALLHLLHLTLPLPTDLTLGLRSSVLSTFPSMHFTFCFSFNVATRALCCACVCVVGKARTYYVPQLTYFLSRVFETVGK